MTPKEAYKYKRHLQRTANRVNGHNLVFVPVTWYVWENRMAQRLRASYIRGNREWFRWYCELRVSWFKRKPLDRLEEVFCMELYSLDNMFGDGNWLKK